MGWPYSNEEVSEIIDVVSDTIFGHLTAPERGPVSTRDVLFSGWQTLVDMDSREAWQAWCMYGEQHCPITKGRGLARDMFSAEQRAMIVLSVKQTLNRAYEERKKT